MMIDELIGNLTAHSPGAADAVLAGVGIALLLFGWVLYRVVLGLAGSVLGAAVGMGIAQLVVWELAPQERTAWILLAVGAVTGLLAGLAIFRFMHAAAFFVAGCVLGGWGYAVIFLRLREAGVELAQSDFLLAFGTPAAAVVSGLVVAWLDRWLIAIASAGAGTLLFLQGLGWPYGPWMAVPVFLLGLLVQVLLASSPPGEDDEDGDD
jgi:hypothetical protein